MQAQGSIALAWTAGDGGCAAAAQPLPRRQPGPSPAANPIGVPDQAPAQKFQVTIYVEGQPATAKSFQAQASSTCLARGFGQQRRSVRCMSTAVRARARSSADAPRAIPCTCRPLLPSSTGSTPPLSILSKSAPWEAGAPAPPPLWPASAPRSPPARARASVRAPALPPPPLVPPPTAGHACPPRATPSAALLATGCAHQSPAPTWCVGGLRGRGLGTGMAAPPPTHSVLLPAGPPGPLLHLLPARPGLAEPHRDPALRSRVRRVRRCRGGGAGTPCGPHRSPPRLLLRLWGWPVLPRRGRRARCGRVLSPRRRCSGVGLHLLLHGAEQGRHRGGLAWALQLPCDAQSRLWAAGEACCLCRLIKSCVLAALPKAAACTTSVMHAKRSGATGPKWGRRNRTDRRGGYSG